MCRRSKLQRLFDQLISHQLQSAGHIDAEQPGRLQVDYELEFCRLQDRQVCGLRAFEDLPGVDADLTVRVRTIGRVAHQPADFDSLASVIGRGNPIVRRERRKLTAPADKEDIGGNEQSIGPVAHAGAEASTSHRVGRLGESLLDHFVDDTKIPRHLRSEEIVALKRFLDLLQRLAGVTDVNFVQALLQT